MIVNRLIGNKNLQQVYLIYLHRKLGLIDIAKNDGTIDYPNLTYGDIIS